MAGFSMKSACFRVFSTAGSSLIWLLPGARGNVKAGLENPMNLNDLTPQNFPLFIEKLDLEANNAQALPGNLITVALLRFLQENQPAFAEGIRLSRVAASTSDGAKYSTLFLGVGPSWSDACFSAFGLTHQSPDHLLFRERLFPASADIDEHHQSLAIDEKMPQAIALVEACVLRMDCAPQVKNAHRPRF